MSFINSYRFKPPAPLPFIFSVTVTAGQSFQLPTVVSGTYDCIIDWGDTTSNALTVWNAAGRSKTYAVGGTYDISISGVFDGFNFFVNPTSRLLIVDVKQWGILGLLLGGSIFTNCTNLTVTATDTLNLSSVTSMAAFFNGCPSLTTIPNIGTWDTSSVIAMNSVFFGATNFNDDVSEWDVSSVENFSQMFRSAINFNQDISGWVTTSATRMDRMFQSARVFNQDIGGWYTNDVTTFFGMFFDADDFDQDISSWVVTSLTDAGSMFGSGSLLSTANYDLLLVGWGGQSVNSSVTLAMNNSKYTALSAAATARGVLTSAPNNWTITDGGAI